MTRKDIEGVRYEKRTMYVLGNYYITVVARGKKKKRTDFKISYSNIPIPIPIPIPKITYLIKTIRDCATRNFIPFNVDAIT
jgi:hypothetical protein